MDGHNAQAEPVSKPRSPIPNPVEKADTSTFIQIQFLKKYRGWKSGHVQSFDPDFANSLIEAKDSRGNPSPIAAVYPPPSKPTPAPRKAGKQPNPMLNRGR